MHEECRTPEVSKMSCRKKGCCGLHVENFWGGFRQPCFTSQLASYFFCRATNKLVCKYYMLYSGSFALCWLLLQNKVKCTMYVLNVNMFFFLTLFLLYCRGVIMPFFLTIALQQRKLAMQWIGGS